MTKFCSNAEALATSTWLDEDLQNAVLWDISTHLARQEPLSADDLEIYKKGYRIGWYRAIAILKKRGFLSEG
jgi:hypothetical protein